MKILAFLQNQWFKDPARMAKEYARWKQQWPDDYREKWVETWLFYGCLTGRRLRKAFGEDRCGEIVWENSSTGFHGKASAAPMADLLHMTNVINKHKPVIVLTFGRIPTDAVAKIEPGGRVISGPHPAARGGLVVGELKGMAEELSRFLSTR